MKVDNCSQQQKLCIGKAVVPTVYGNSPCISNTQNDSVSFQGAEKILTNKTLHKVLEFASDNQATCLATVALFLGGILRPATILSLPGKGKEDKQYASGHSIASAIIGYTFTSILLKPISDPIKRLGKEPWNLFCDLDDEMKKHIKILKDDPKLSEKDIEQEIIRYLNRNNDDPNKLITLKDYAKPEYKYLFADPTDLIQKNKKLFENKEFVEAYESALSKGNTKKAAALLQGAARDSSEVFEEMCGVISSKSKTLIGAAAETLENIEKGDLKALTAAADDKLKPFAHLSEQYEQLLENITKLLKSKKPAKEAFNTLMEQSKTVVKNVEEAMPKVLMSSGKAFRNWKGFSTASKILNLGVDFIFAIPKAVLTVALNPYILKYVFHVEKPKKGSPVVPNIAKAFNFANAPKLSTLESVKGGAK